MLALCVNDLSAFEVSRYFSDGMVLQRDKENQIWGTGAKDETVTFSGQTKTAKLDSAVMARGSKLTNLMPFK